MEAELSSSPRRPRVFATTPTDVENASADLESNVEQEKLYRNSILPQAETNFRSRAEHTQSGQDRLLTFEARHWDLDSYETEIAPAPPASPRDRSSSKASDARSSKAHRNREAACEKLGPRNWCRFPPVTGAPLALQEEGPAKGRKRKAVSGRSLYVYPMKPR